MSPEVVCLGADMLRVMGFCLSLFGLSSADVLRVIGLFFSRLVFPIGGTG
jgi:hypothetical protein